MKAVLNLLVFVPLGIVLVALAVANRGNVKLGFDPFVTDGSSPTLELPLFIALFAALTFGVLIGGIASWISQGKHRRAARLARAETAQLRAQMLENSR